MDVPRPSSGRTWTGSGVQMLGPNLLFDLVQASIHHTILLDGVQKWPKKREGRQGATRSRENNGVGCILWLRYRWGKRGCEQTAQITSAPLTAPWVR